MSRLHSIPRFIRLGLFGLLAFTIAILGLAVGMAWVYVYGLTHPGCDHNPQPLARAPAPEEVWLETEDGLRLRGWYYAPREGVYQEGAPPKDGPLKSGPREGGTANGATILLLGGPGGSLGQSLPPADFLIEAGYGVMQVDSRACTQPAAQVTLGANEVLEAEAALAYLKTRPEVGRIGIFGFSMGGVTAIRAAARHMEIEAVVAEGGYYNMGKDFIDADLPKPMLVRAFLYLVAGIFRLQTGVDPFAISPVDDLPKISPRPVLLIYGSEEIASGRGEMQFKAARYPKELWVVDGGEHGTNYALAGEKYKTKVLGFFAQHLAQK